MGLQECLLEPRRLDLRRIDPHPLAPVGPRSLDIPAFLFYIVYITDITQATFTQIIFEKTVGTFKDLNGQHWASLRKLYRLRLVDHK